MNNTVSIPVGELKPALAGLAKVIDPRSPVEALRCVRVEAGETGIQLLGTDSETFVRFAIGEEQTGIEQPIHIPFAKLQELARRMPPQTLLHLREGGIQCDLGTGRIEESFDPIDPKTFPEEPGITESPVELPEAFPARFREALGCASKESSRPILNGVLLDADDRKGHYLVATDGRHLFSANSFTLPVPRSVVLPSLRILFWRGLGDAGLLPSKKKAAGSASMRASGPSPQKPSRAATRTGDRSFRPHHKSCSCFRRTIRSRMS